MGMLIHRHLIENDAKQAQEAVKQPSGVPVENSTTENEKPVKSPVSHARRGGRRKG